MGKPFTARFRKAYCGGQNHFQIDTLATDLKATSYFAKLFFCNSNQQAGNGKDTVNKTEMTDVEGKISQV